MRVRLLALLSLTILALAPVAQAQVLVPRIGFYEDPAGTDCSVEILSNGTAKTIYCVAILGTQPHQPQDVRGVQFYVQNWVNTHNTPPFCFVTTTWFGSAIGAPDNAALGGISIALDGAPIAGPVVPIGTVRYQDFGWIAANHVMNVINGPTDLPGDDEKMKITDGGFVERLANGEWITLKCASCPCGYSQVPADEASWSDIKALY